MSTETGSYERVVLTVEDDVAELRLSHPEKLNCFSLELAEDLRDLTLAVEDYDVSAVVVTAEGRSFSAGADLAVLNSDDPADSERLRELYGTVFEWMRNEPIPVVAGARGHVVGAGASLLCYAADLRVAGEDVEIWWPEVAYGIAPLSRTISLSKEIGAPHALELMLLGEEGKMSAQEAHTLGMINRVVAPEAVEDEARSMAETIAGYDREHDIAGEFLEVLKQARQEEGSVSTAYAKFRRNVHQNKRYE